MWTVPGGTVKRINDAWFVTGGYKPFRSAHACHPITDPPSLASSSRTPSAIKMLYWQALISLFVGYLSHISEAFYSSPGGIVAGARVVRPSSVWKMSTLSSSSPSGLEVEVISDFACPWYESTSTKAVTFSWELELCTRFD